MKAGITVLTNNPLVREAFPEAEWVEGLPSEVARRARDRVHAGWRLAAHPLAGSIRLLRSPYRSLALEEASPPADARQVQMIEEAVARLERRELLDKSPENDADYRLLDLDLFRRVMGSLGD
ncbi:MAG: GrdX family protein [Synergistales bacterium]